MFGQHKQPPIKSLIASGTIITGDIAFADGLRIDGHVTGHLIASQDTHSLLVVSETAVIIGEVRADHVIINGTVQGPIYAQQLLELQPKARVDGDVSYKALEMHQGAIIAGQLRPVTGSAESKPVLKLTSHNVESSSTAKKTNERRNNNTSAPLKDFE